MSSCRAWLLACTLLSCLVGCSLVRNLSAEQCSTDGDCSGFGDYFCSTDNVCVARETGSSGSSGASGSSSMSTAGAAGASEAPECATNVDCIDAHEGEPYICREGACVPLTLPDHCPFVVAGTEEDPNEYLKAQGKPIIFGAYVPISTANPETHPYTLNFRFALEEFMQGTQGGVGQPARPFVMVLCQSTEPDLEASVAHLADTVQVPAILATLPSADLSKLFQLTSARSRKVFLLGPLEADNSLASAPDQGLIWHMLGPMTDLMSAYVPLMERVEQFVLDQKGEGPLKVAVVHSDLTYSVDLANAFQNQIEVNGQPLTAQTNTNYKRFEVKVDGVEEPDASAVINALKRNGTFAADIVVSMGGTEFVDPIMPAIQAGRTIDDTPFYLFSPRNAFDDTLTSGSFFMESHIGWTLFKSAGVNYASVEDSKLYDQYLASIQAKYPGQEGLESRENLYDAAYFMLYSLAAASFTTSGDFDGNDVLNGMKALVDGDTPASVGPGVNGEMHSLVLTTLLTGGKVALTGTLGPPDFNPVTGARKSPGSVWCLENPGVVHFDQARLDPDMPGELKLVVPEFCNTLFP